MDSFDEARYALRDVERDFLGCLRKLLRVAYLRKPDSRLRGEVAFLGGDNRLGDPIAQLFLAWAEDHGPGPVLDLAREADAALATATRLVNWSTSSRNAQATLDVVRTLRDLMARATALRETLQMPARVAFRVRGAKIEVADVQRRGKTFLEVRGCHPNGSPDPTASLQRLEWKRGIWCCGEVWASVWDAQGETFDGPRR